MSRPFEITAETIVHATPEQAWDAINTPEGIASWLFPMPRGEGESAWGGHDAVEWDPPRHSVMRMTGPDGTVVNQLENTFVDNGDGTLTIRYVHSGVFGEDDWDTMYDGASRHTSFYQHTLAQYLRHFNGRHAAYVTASGPDASREPGSFGRTIAAMGIGDGASVGDRVSFEVEGYGTVDGEIDYLRENFLGIRSADALYRVFGREVYGGEPVSVSHHLFADGIDVDSAQAAWQRWIDGVFAAAPVS